MKFWRSSKRSINLVQEKKSKKSSSCMKTLFQFFAKGTFLGPKKKFLPSPIPSPQTPVVEKPIQAPILVEEKKIDDLQHTIPTAKPKILKKKPHSIVAKLMGLESPAPPQKTPKLVPNPSEFPSLKSTSDNTSQFIDHKHSQPLLLPPKLKDEPKLAPPDVVENNTSIASKSSYTDRQKLEEINKEMNSGRLVKSPPRSVSPVNNERILQATARLLDIGSENIKLNRALSDLDALKIDTKSSTDHNKAMKNAAASNAEIKKDAQNQKGSNRRNAQGNVSAKMPPKLNKKQNRAPVNSQKDFIAINRSLIKTMPLRTKSKGFEKKQETKNSVKKVRQTDSNSRSEDVKIRKVSGANNVKRGGKEMLISKGIGMLSEKPQGNKRDDAKEEDDMCIVSFTFSAPMIMKHPNRCTSSSDSEGRTDSGLTDQSSVSSLALLDDGNSNNDTRIITTAIHEGTSLYDEFASGRSNGLSDTKLDADKIETSLKQTKDENLMNEVKIAPNNAIDKTSDKRSSETSRRVRPIKSRQHKTSYNSHKIELLMQNFISSKNCEDKVSSFLFETTESVLKSFSKVPNNYREIDQLREIITDFVMEQLYTVQSRILNCGYNSWQNFRAFYTKERIQRDVEKEIVELQNSVGKKMEVVIGKDMENWMDSRVSFEIGIQIEKEIISQLIGEVVHDFIEQT